MFIRHDITDNAVSRQDLYKDSVRTFTIKLDKHAGRLGTTVSSADWETLDNSILSLSNEALASGVATVDVTASQTGRAVLKLTGTMANGETTKHFVEIRVTNPEYCY